MTENKKAKPENEAKQDGLDEFLESTQAKILSGARKARKTYSSLKQGKTKLNTDSSVLAFGAGLGAGLGLGAALVFKMTPVGRIASLVVGAATGALLSSLDQSRKDDAKAPETEASEPEPDLRKAH